MTTQTIQPIYLKDYQKPAYQINKIHLTIDLCEEKTQVYSELEIQRVSDSVSPLILNGEELNLIALTIDGRSLIPNEYEHKHDQLIIPIAAKTFKLSIHTEIQPNKNTALSGLYLSQGIFCTQCEAEGFRRITYFLDRPDILTEYTTTIRADKTRYPVLLSNGNCLEQKDLADNRYEVTWHDPFKKPSYLFALVAGALDCLVDQFTTASAKTVTLKIFTQKGKQNRALHAMNCLKKAMRWDEIHYGREYDLDIFMIVAIDDFNMGAMENKGLNIFNSKYLLVDPETATDIDYENVLAVIAHEYFHNWTGNRVTCRDWFQLSLKEGLTVFREQQFTQEQTSSATIARINEVKVIRDTQFKEDEGPLAHPVQPDSYIEIDNFYTATVYNKGAEVIRMLHTLLGPKLFRAGMDLYFECYDGQAVTIEDFIHSFEKVSQQDLSQFRLWYKQAGTPEVNIEFNYQPETKTFKLQAQQSCPPTPGQAFKKPFHIPLRFGLLNKLGQEHPLQNTVLELKTSLEEFLFESSEELIPSVFRDFSAPVKLKINYSEDMLYLLAKQDPNDFNRWQAMQTLTRLILLKQLHAAKLDLPKQFVELSQSILLEQHADRAFISELLTLPSEYQLSESLTPNPVDEIHRIRLLAQKTLAQQLYSELLAYYETALPKAAYQVSPKEIGQRKLKNNCLTYLMLDPTEVVREYCLAQYQAADNMTDRLAAFRALAQTREYDAIVQDFYERWQTEPLVIDKWFAIQASSNHPDTFKKVQSLLFHPAFQLKNPNRVYALIYTFTQNSIFFHAADGSGYRWVAQQVIDLNRLNPQVAGRLIQALTSWRRYDSARQNLMRSELENILQVPNLSKHIFEIAYKSLE